MNQCRPGTNASAPSSIFFPSIVARKIHDSERRARLGQRHQLSEPFQASSPVEVARALTALHGTDPASTVLGILARSPGSDVSDVESSYYVDRSLVRVPGMRRTLFAVDYQLAPAVWVSSENTLTRGERRTLVRLLEGSGIRNVEIWIERLNADCSHFSMQILRARATKSLRLIRFWVDACPLAGRLVRTQRNPSRVVSSSCCRLKERSCEPVPREDGHRTSSLGQRPSHWRSDWPARPDPEDADIAIVRSWLFGHGPATLKDLTWWTGWSQGRSRHAIEGAGGVEIETEEGLAFVRNDDLEPVSDTAPWAALLPGLDSSTMGWKQRNFYLGSHAERLFDRDGNGGPTVWVNGRIVGGWVQLDSGKVAYQLFEDVGRDALNAIAETAGILEQTITDIRLKPRSRAKTITVATVRHSPRDGSRRGHWPRSPR